MYLSPHTSNPNVKGEFYIAHTLWLFILEKFVAAIVGKLDFQFARLHFFLYTHNMHTHTLMY